MMLTLRIHERYGDPRIAHNQHQYLWDKKTIEHPREFYAVMEFESIYSVRSGVLVWWRNMENGLLYPMNMAGLKKLLKGSEFQKPALVDGKWRFQKRGQHISIEPVFAEEEP